MFLTNENTVLPGHTTHSAALAMRGEQQCLTGVAVKWEVDHKVRVSPLVPPAVVSDSDSRRGLRQQLGQKEHQANDQESVDDSLP